MRGFSSIEMISYLITGLHEMAAAVYLVFIYCRHGRIMPAGDDARAAGRAASADT